MDGLVDCLSHSYRTNAQDCLGSETEDLGDEDYMECDRQDQGSCSGHDPPHGAWATRHRSSSSAKRDSDTHEGEEYGENHPDGGDVCGTAVDRHGASGGTAGAEVPGVEEHGGGDVLRLPTEG